VRPRARMQQGPHRATRAAQRGGGSGPAQVLHRQLQALWRVRATQGGRAAAEHCDADHVARTMHTLLRLAGWRGQARRSGGGGGGVCVTDTGEVGGRLVGMVAARDVDFVADRAGTPLREVMTACAPAPASPPIPGSCHLALCCRAGLHTVAQRSYMHTVQAPDLPRSAMLGALDMHTQPAFRFTLLAVTTRHILRPARGAHCLDSVTWVVGQEVVACYSFPFCQHWGRKTGRCDTLLTARLRACRDVEAAAEACNSEQALQQLRSSRRKLLPVVNAAGELVRLADGAEAHCAWPQPGRTRPVLLKKESLLTGYPNPNHIPNPYSHQPGTIAGARSGARAVPGGAAAAARGRAERGRGRAAAGGRGRGHARRRPRARRRAARRRRARRRHSGLQPGRAPPAALPRPAYVMEVLRRGFFFCAPIFVCARYCVVPAGMKEQALGPVFLRTPTDSGMA